MIEKLIYLLPFVPIFQLPYISSGLWLVARTSATITSQSRPRLSASLPLAPTRQCSLPWFSQWPVRPVRIILCNWLVFTQIISSTLWDPHINIDGLVKEHHECVEGLPGMFMQNTSYPQSLRHSLPSSMALPVTHRNISPSSCKHFSQVAARSGSGTCSSGTGSLRISSSLIVP